MAPIILLIRPVLAHNSRTESHTVVHVYLARSGTPDSRLTLSPPRVTKFGAVIPVGQERVSKVSATLPSQGGGAPTSPKFLVPLPAPKRLDLERWNLI